MKYQLNEKLNVDNMTVDLKVKNLNKNLETSFLKNKTSEAEYKLLVKKLRVNLEYKEFVKVAFIVITAEKSAVLLANIISVYLKKTQKQKKHNFLFLNFKKIFSLLINSKLSKISGLKISVSGRFNGFLRSKKKVFTLGCVPLQSFSSLIDYHQTTSYTVYGTFGVKVWIFKKQ